MAKLKNLELAKGLLTIAGATASPWVAWASGQATLMASIALSVVACLTTTANWLDSAISQRKAAKAAAGLPDETLPPEGPAA